MKSIIIILATFSFLLSYSQVEEKPKKEDQNQKIIEQNDKIIEQNNKLLEQNNSNNNAQTQQAQQPKQKKAKQKKGGFLDKIYTGGSFGLAINSNYTSLIFEPLIGYRIIDKIYVGTKFTYIRTRYYDFDNHKYNDFGGSVYTQIYPVPFTFFHFEPAFMNYQIRADNSDREVIPFIWIGGGFRRTVAKNAWVTAKFLFDVYNHPDSPYIKGHPIISVGVGFGL